jgi:hypothetical protein
MDYRDPVALIDETIDNLMYLVAWLLEDIDVGALQSELLARDAVKSIAALRAIHAVLPRLRIVRSNFVSSPSLPDARDPRGADSPLIDYSEQGRAELRKYMNSQPDKGEDPGR